MNAKLTVGFLLLSVLILNFHAGAKSFYSDGVVDNSSGTPHRDLVYRDFEITKDGYVTGFIINESNHPLKSVKLDMWTTNRSETRILWRKSLNIGDMAPKGKFEVREPYSPFQDDPSGVVFKFRLPGATNFRNPVRQ
ncbi:MAG TPA: hypothetical protein VEF34_03355 [Syntrophobacteraceae bacterium]|nr:hypothetical protein [Syntrophobacteraceae bacterium]